MNEYSQGLEKKGTGKKEQSGLSLTSKSHSQTPRTSQYNLEKPKD
jgi:ribosomal protein L28